jgi:hypothetical protein
MEGVVSWLKYGVLPLTLKQITSPSGIYGFYFQVFLDSSRTREPFEL